MKSILAIGLMALILMGTAYAAEVEDDEEDFSDESVAPYVVPESTGHKFLETFQEEPFESGRWVESTHSSYDGQQWSHGPAKESSEAYEGDLVSLMMIRKTQLVYTAPCL